VAERLFHLVRNGICITNLNSERLLKVIEEKGGDPFAYDPVSIETGLADGSFTYYSIKKLPARAVELVFASGTWFLESPCASCCASNGTDPVFFPSVTLGFHTLFRAPTGERMSLYIMEKEAIAFSP
jgi:hypothetical protein